MSNERIEIELLAEPRELSMANRATFEIGIAATNRDTTTVDPGLHLARLLINGQDSLQFGDAIANGLRDEEWFELPPGETVSMTWPAMGEIFFPGPGEYELKLRLGETESSPAVIRVG